MRHVIAFVCFALLCTASAAFFDGNTGVLLLGIALALPLFTVAWVFAVTKWDARQTNAGRTAPPDGPSALPPGVEWSYPERRPGGCGGPEADEDVED